MTEVTVKENIISIEHKDIITSGSQNAFFCHFIFSPEWDSLQKTVTFRADNAEKSDILGNDGICAIPPEVTREPSSRLMVGVCGTSDGNEVYPTIWAYIGPVREGATPAELTEGPPENLYAQIYAKAENAERIAQSVRSDADEGAFDGDDYLLTAQDKQNIADAAVPLVMETQEIQKMKVDILDAKHEAIMALDIAKGVNKAKGFNSYSDLIQHIYLSNTEDYQVGQSFLIVTLDVPDLWLSGIADEWVPCELDDAEIVAELNASGYIQVGHYKLSMLETPKQDLTNYVKNTDYASEDHTGIVKVSGFYGTETGSNGLLVLAKASEAEIAKKASAYKPIVPVHLDYAVKVGVTDNQIQLTPEEQAAAQAWLGVIGIKTIIPDENGEYRCHILEMEDGIYYLPSGTVVQYRATPVLSKVMEGCAFLLVGTQDSSKNFHILGFRYGIILHGYENSTFGIMSNIYENYIAYTNSGTTVTGEWKFKTSPNMTGELAADDNSTKIPSTAWVQAAIGAALAEKGL